MKYVTVTEFQRAYPGILNSLKEPITITRRGSPIAVIQGYPAVPGPAGGGEEDEGIEGIEEEILGIEADESSLDSGGIEVGREGEDKY